MKEKNALAAKRYIPTQSNNQFNSVESTHNNYRLNTGDSKTMKERIYNNNSSDDDDGDDNGSGNDGNGRSSKPNHNKTNDKSLDRYCVSKCVLT